jgi:uncharacterized protein (TIGR02594 family)
MNILAIQTALSAQGFNPGDLDGIWGRRTIFAVKAFQKARGLEVDGIVGPLTLRALLGTTSPTLPHSSEGGAVPLVWYDEARSLIGTKEIAGRNNDPTIMKWAKGLNIDYDNDDIPWCGLFVGHCIGATLPEEEIPPGLLMARAWRRFGEQCQPMRGAVLVFWRGKRDGSLGHVGFYHSEDDQSYHVLGGNQNNAVNLARLSKQRLLAARWPRTARILTGGVVVARGEGPLSHDES